MNTDFLILTDTRTGFPMLARTDQIVATCPSHHASGDVTDGTVVILATGDMHLLVRETAMDVLDKIAALKAPAS